MDCYQYIVSRNPSKLDAGLRRVMRFKDEDDVTSVRRRGSGGNRVLKSTTPPPFRPKLAPPPKAHTVPAAAAPLPHGYPRYYVVNGFFSTTPAAQEN